MSAVTFKMIYTEITEWHSIITYKTPAAMVVECGYTANTCVKYRGNGSTVIVIRNQLSLIKKHTSVYSEHVIASRNDNEIN